MSSDTANSAVEAMSGRSLRGPGLRRFWTGEGPAGQAQVRLEASRIIARRGDLEEARRLLRAAVQVEPGSAEAWLRLAWLTEDRRERKALLRRVLALEPGHVQAQVELARLQCPASQLAALIGTDESRLRRWAWGLLSLAACLFLMAALAWGWVDGSIGWSRRGLTEISGLAWWMPTAAPTPTPTPTLTPSQIASQFLVQLQDALSGANWDRALEIAAIMQGVDPSGQEVQQWALATHMQYGQALVQSGEMDQALTQFDRAVALLPNSAEARLWQQTTQMYLTGQAALEAGEWAVAIQSFAQALDQMPDYGDLAARLTEAYTRQGQAAIEVEDWTTAIEALTQAHERLPGDTHVAEMLSLAYRQRGITWQGKGKLQKARADLEAALALQPGDAEAQAYLDQVMYELFPPKRIEIDISEQRFYAWEGDTLVYRFLTSTGLRGRDTATGHFKVLDKMPMAYSSVWRLKMPYWLGIYYVGNIENGIHALPIRPDGSVMWAGLLGRRASYGCIILDNDAAQLIYNWAEIGIPVDIHY